MKIDGNLSETVTLTSTGVQWCASFEANYEAFFVSWPVLKQCFMNTRTTIQTRAMRLYRDGGISLSRLLILKFAVTVLTVVIRLGVTAIWQLVGPSNRLAE